MEKEIEELGHERVKIIQENDAIIKKINQEIKLLEDKNKKIIA